jgi:hypothetical protein
VVSTVLRTSHRVVIATLALLGPAAVSGRLAAQAPCPPLPAPTGTVIEVQPAQVGDLPAIVAGAAAGTTILLDDGTYDLNGSFLHVTTPGLTLRSASGDREAVVLDGSYVSGELISIQASNTTVADLTLTRAYFHPIHVSGPGVPISGVLIHNVHIIDPGEQAVKVNPVGEGTVDDSTLRCSHIELTDAGRTHIRNNCYTGGLDAHRATGWRVWRNRVEGFWCEEGLSEHGIHLWRASADTVVEENVILDCARGIGFGLGSGADGHSGGVIRNNFVAAADGDLFASEYGFDAGIALWGAEGAAVYHNTVASTQSPFSSIEWRFISTSVALANNLTTGPIRDRGGSAVLTTNLESVSTDLFSDVVSGDLHLVGAESSPVDAGTALAAGACAGDLDGQGRDASPDVGADEFGRPIFSDGFEFGITGAWSAVSS